MISEIILRKWCIPDDLTHLWYKKETKYRNRAHEKILGFGYETDYYQAMRVKRQKEKRQISPIRMLM